MEFNKHVQVRKEKFGAVIFETLKEKVFVTNATGAEIVHLIQGKKTREEIVSELAEIYGTDAGTIAGEVDEFINNLVQQDILAQQ